MSRAVLVPAAEAVGAAVMLALAVWCWMRGISRSEFEPVVPGAPPFTSVDYSGSWIGAAFAAALAAGLLALDAVRRRRRASTHRGYHE